jgi:hypothetical protein
MLWSLLKYLIYKYLKGQTEGDLMSELLLWFNLQVGIYFL